MTAEIMDGYTTTNIKWKIENLYKCFLSPPSEKFSKEFTLDQTQIEFSLYFDSCSPMTKPGHKPLGVVVRKFDKTDVMKVSVKLWIESEGGMQMTDHLFPDFEFSASQHKCGFSLELGKEFNFFNSCFTKDESLMLCASFEYAVLTTNTLLDLSIPSKPSLFIKVQERVFKANKEAMMNASFCFQKLLSTSDAYTIELDDLPEDVGEALIVWIHCKKISTVANIINKLFVVADKYEMAELKLECLKSMAHNVNAEDLFTFLVLGFMYEKDVPQLKQNVLEFAVQKPRSKRLTSLFNSKEWAELVAEDREFADKVMNAIFDKTEEL